MKIEGKAVGGEKRAGPAMRDPPHEFNREEPVGRRRYEIRRTCLLLPLRAFGPAGQVVLLVGGKFVYMDAHGFQF